MDEPAPAVARGGSENSAESVHAEQSVPADTDAEPEDEAEDPPSGFERFRTESAVGGVVTGVARGLRDVFAPVPDPPAIVAAVPGDPPDADRRVRVVLDPDDPTKSVAIVPGAEPPAPSVPPEATEPPPPRPEGPADDEGPGQSP